MNWIKWIKRLFGKPEPVRVKVEPCPICARLRAKISHFQEMGFTLLVETTERDLHSHIASTHYYPKVTK